MSGSDGSDLERGIRLHRAGRLGEAEQIYRGIGSGSSQRADALHLLAIVAYQRADAGAALSSVREAIERDSTRADFHGTLGLVLAASGDSAAARAAYERAVALAPSNVVVLTNLGNLLLASGFAAEAVARLSVAARLAPDDPEIKANLMLALLEVDDLAGAIAAGQDALERAELLGSRASELASNVATLLLRAGRGAEAHDLLESIAPPGPASATFEITRGNVLQALGDDDAALEAYERALRAEPGSRPAVGNLAALRERRGDVEAAQRLLVTGLRDWPGDALINLVGSRLARRRGDLAGAGTHLDKVDPARLEAAEREPLAFERAALLDRAGRYDEAWTALVEANRLARAAALAAGVSPERFLALLDRLEAFVPRSSQPHDVCASEAAPIFVVGFPRSGTTLFGRILDAHPALETLDERPLLASAIDWLAGRTAGYPAALDALGAGEAAHLRCLYEKEANALRARGDERRIVDKFPLNMAHLALLDRLYPGAPVILVVRHPCDACLSAFMQRFEPNDAMANFYSLGEAVRLYDRVMTVFQATAAALGSRCHVLRYEDLVVNFDGEVGAALEYVGLPWDDGLRAFAARTAGRAAIRTPSYLQVTEPIHDRSIGRWLRYQEFIASDLAPLDRWIEHFGYPSRRMG